MTPEEVSNLEHGDKVELTDRSVVTFLYRRSQETVMVETDFSHYNQQEVPNSLLWRVYPSIVWKEEVVVETPRCNCGGRIAQVPHSDWCWTVSGKP